MPPRRDKPRGLLSFLGLFTRRECERYAAELGEKTRDFQRRKAVEAARLSHAPRRTVRALEEMPPDGYPPESSNTIPFPLKSAR